MTQHGLKGQEFDAHWRMGPVKRDPEKPSKTSLEEGWTTSSGEETASGLPLTSR